jgi:transcriptional regulator with XRE-family HTH domain
MLGNSQSEKPYYSELLVEARNASGLSQGEAADLLGVHRTTYCNAENGRGTPGVFANIHDVYPDRADAILDAWQQEYGRSTKAKQINDDEAMFIRSGRQQQLSGIWHALWETTVDAKTVFNTEIVRAEWKRRKLVIGNEAISPENPEGGYLWRGELDFVDNSYLMGLYWPLDKEVSSRGTMFGVFHRSGRSIRGMWVGCNYDAELTHGCFIFSKRRQDLSSLMKRDFGLEVVLTSSLSVK